MASSVDILRAGSVRLRRDGLSVLVPLVIGVILARVLTFIVTLVLTLLLIFFLGGDRVNVLMMIVFVVAGTAGVAFWTVALGSATRSALTEQGGDDLRSYGIAAIPTGILVAGLTTLANMAAGPLLGALVAVPLMWGLTLAVVDIACDGEGSGLGAAWTILMRTPGSLLAVAGAVLLVDVLVVLAAVLVPIVLPLATIPALLIRIMLSIELYGATFELPAAQLSRQASEYGLQRSEGRASMPSWMQSADELDPELEMPGDPGSAVDAVTAGSPAVHGLQVPAQTGADPIASAPAAAGVVDLVQQSAYGVGGWVSHPVAGQLVVQLDPTATAVATAAFACDQLGHWITLEPGAAGWTALMPQGPWFVAVHGAPSGSRVAWQVMPAIQPEVAA